MIYSNLCIYLYLYIFTFIAEIRHFVGGPEYYYLLLEPIELLAVVEEGSVRDAVSYFI